MNILVTGANGLVGAALAPRLASSGHQVMPLRRGAAGSASEATWNPDTRQVRLPVTVPFEAVVHLAGENIAQRWTPAAKARIRASRVDATRLLSEALAGLPSPPRVLICASATGYYGDRGGEVLDEQSSPGAGFLAKVCQEWEAAAAPARNRGIRVVHLRLGVVLARHGGALAKLLPAFRFGLGGRLGSGRQYWGWIALADLLSVAEWALQDGQVSGVVNAVSPEATTNAFFTEALARALRRPAFLSVPASVVRGLFGEMGREALLSSARVRPTRLLDANFPFRFPSLEATFRHLLTAKRH
jgi:uncharacterized protein (TIGR01777 family)